MTARSRAAYSLRVFWNDCDRWINLGDGVVWGAVRRVDDGRQCYDFTICRAPVERWHVVEVAFTNDRTFRDACNRPVAVVRTKGGFALVYDALWLEEPAWTRRR